MGYAVAAASATERPSRWSREIRPLDAGRWLSGLCRRVLPIAADMPSEPSSPPNTRAPLSVKAGQAHVYPFIEAEKRGRRNVTRACELLKVSRAAFYEHLKGPSGRGQQDADLAAKIQSVHEESKGRYGAPRVHAELRRRGQRHGRKRVARLMRQAGLQGRAARRWKKTTIADPAAAARADRIRRDFTTDASRLNSRWCGDITYIRTWEGWLFLATVIDIASAASSGTRWPITCALGSSLTRWATLSPPVTPTPA
jgi:HTH-like domain